MVDQSEHKILRLVLIKASVYIKLHQHIKKQKRITKKVFFELTCSSKSLHAGPGACLQFYEIACSNISIGAAVLVYYPKL